MTADVRSIHVGPRREGVSRWRGWLELPCYNRTSRSASQSTSTNQSFLSAGARSGRCRCGIGFWFVGRSGGCLAAASCRRSLFPGRSDRVVFGSIFARASGSLGEVVPRHFGVGGLDLGPTAPATRGPADGRVDLSRVTRRRRSAEPASTRGSARFTASSNARRRATSRDARTRQRREAEPPLLGRVVIVSVVRRAGRPGLVGRRDRRGARALLRAGDWIEDAGDPLGARRSTWSWPTPTSSSTTTTGRGRRRLRAGRGRRRPDRRRRDDQGTHRRRRARP